MRDASAIDRLPPHSQEAEKAALGTIIDCPNDGLMEAATGLPAGTDEFYDLRHQIVYGSLLTLAEVPSNVNLVTLYQDLKDSNQAEQVGGLEYLSQLLSASGPVGALSDYLAIIHQKYLLRKMIQTCTQAVGQLYDPGADAMTVIDATEKAIIDVRRTENAIKTPDMRTLVCAAITQIEKAHATGGGLTGLSTGFTDLDKMTCGLQPAEMIVFAARPSVGKTSIAMNIAEHVAIELQLPVGVFSLEMTAQALVSRMLCSRARVNARSVSTGFLTERDFPKLTGATSKLSKAPIHIDDSRSLSIMQLRAKARRMRQEYSIKLLIIDYLQLLNDFGSSRRWENRQQEVANISCGIKCLAGELNIPVLVLAQLNRDIEREKNRKPRLSDLRESGAVEQDADVVGLMYRPEKDGDDNESGAVPVNLLIAKQRNGGRGDVHFTFFEQYTRFESAARVSDDDVPDRQLYRDA